MRFTLTFLLFAAGMLAQGVPAAQNPPPPVVTGRPQTRVQPGTTAQQVSPDTVVAKLNGKPLTVADVDKLLGDIPLQYQGVITRDPERFLNQLLVFNELEKEAEQQGLDKESPIRQELAYGRMMALARAEVDKSRNGILVSSDQEQQYYEQHKEDMFRVVKAKVIFVAFSATAAKPPAPGANGGTPSEADAQAKIDDLRKQILAGAEFGKLAKENSDDKISAAKEGDYGDIIRTSPYPDPIKKAIFALKPGEVSDVIRQPSGFYLIKAASSSYQPLDEVRNEIRNALIDEEFKKHMSAIEAQFNVTVEDRSYFTTRPPH